MVEVGSLVLLPVEVELVDALLVEGAVSTPALMPSRASASESAGPEISSMVLPGLTVIFRPSELAP